jgi:hypothetical protein
MEIKTDLPDWDEMPVETQTIRNLRKIKSKMRYSAYVPGVPLEVLRALRPLGGAAMTVGLLIWREARIERRIDGLRLSGTVLEAVALSRYAFYRALEALEVAGLVSVSRRRGCRPTLSAQGILALKSWAPSADGPTD